MRVFIVVSTSWPDGNPCERAESAHLTPAGAASAIESWNREFIAKYGRHPDKYAASREVREFRVLP